TAQKSQQPAPWRQARYRTPGRRCGMLRGRRLPLAALGCTGADTRLLLFSLSISLSIRSRCVSAFHVNNDLLHIVALRFPADEAVLMVKLEQGQLLEGFQFFGAHWSDNTGAGQHV